MIPRAEWTQYYKVIKIPYGRKGWYHVDMMTGLSFDVCYLSYEDAEFAAIRKYEHMMETFEKAIWGEEQKI